jgi:hypothetical protein
MWCANDTLDQALNHATLCATLCYHGISRYAILPGVVNQDPSLPKVEHGLGRVAIVTSQNARCLAFDIYL